MMVKAIGLSMLMAVSTMGVSLRSVVSNKLDSSGHFNSLGIRIKGFHTLTLCEVEMYDHSGNKIVPFRADQSSTKYGGGAELAIDGSTKQTWDWDANSCTHTSDEESPSWVARFHEPVENVAKIVIYNRIDPNCYGPTTPAQGTPRSCQSRLDGTIVRLNNRPVGFIEHAGEKVEIIVPEKWDDPKCSEYSYSGNTYNICKDYVTRSEASQKCKQWGGELAIIENAEENKAIIDKVLEIYGCVPSFPGATAFWDAMYVIGNTASSIDQVPEGIQVFGNKFTGYKSNIINAFCHHRDANNHYKWSDMADFIATGYVCKKSTSKTKHIGCFVDKIYDRDLPHAAKWSSTELTLEENAELCRSKGYKYAGIQWKNQVFCGNEYGKHGSSTACTCGDPNNKGAYVNCIYEVGN